MKDTGKWRRVITELEPERLDIVRRVPGVKRFASLLKVESCHMPIE